MDTPRKFAIREDPPPAELARNLDLVEERVVLAGRELRLLRPRSADALLDEEAFEREEFLPYWAELWPSGLALARELERTDVAGRRVLELGCGLAVPSFAAALGEAADVLATDWSPNAIEMLAVNAERNGVRLRGARVAWERPSELLEGAPWELVLAADVLYERRNVDVLVSLLPRLVAVSGCLMLADPGRPAAPSLFAALAELGWRVEGKPTRPGSAPGVSRLRPPPGR